MSGEQGLIHSWHGSENQMMLQQAVAMGSSILSILSVTSKERQFPAFVVALKADQKTVKF
jgi:hypothetical protein